MADEHGEHDPDAGTGDESSFDESEPIDARPDDPNIPENPNIQPASLWCRKDIKEFKDAIRKDSAEGVIKIGNGETATIRVPTHEDGNSLFWEFATDHYDIGFGLYFEWTDVVTDKVTVHISESSDEEDEERVLGLATDHYDIGFGLYFEWTDVVTDKVTVHISESSDEEDEERVLGLATDHYDIGFGLYFEWTDVVTDKVTVHISESSDEEDEERVLGLATDHYDIGFGLYFEWTDVVTDKVTVHISESSDEEDEELQEDGTVVDPEQGDRMRDRRFSADEIIPIYRRDSHEEVYVGSHLYPGQGIYLLKFDNSYSLWRSKTLYYRVYYSNSK